MNSPTCFISRVPDNGHRLGTLVLVISAELVVLCPPTQSRFRYVWTCPLPVRLPTCLGRTRFFVFYSLSSDHTGNHFAIRNLIHERFLFISGWTKIFQEPSSIYWTWKTDAILTNPWFRALLSQYIKSLVENRRATAVQKPPSDSVHGKEVVTKRTVTTCRVSGFTKDHCWR